jgi:hypothetical protein
MVNGDYRLWEEQALNKKQMMKDTDENVCWLGEGTVDLPVSLYRYMSYLPHGYKSDDHSSGHCKKIVSLDEDRILRGERVMP